MLLEVKNLSVYYGVIQALKGIDFHVDEGEIVALIGANGAGKTTILHTISGLIAPRAGEIRFKDKDIVHVPGEKRVGMGIAQVPEGRRVFPDMTVEENLKMGAYSRRDGSETDTMNMIFDRFPRLKERRNQLSGTLSGGEQQMLSMGRALMSKPEILLLDEPSMGLSPILVNEVFDIIRSVHEEGTTVLLVEQNARKALNIADRAYVLETGTIAAYGNAFELLNDDSIRKAYLGE